LMDWLPERISPPDKYAWTEHAERNAIYAAAQRGTATAGCRMYLTWQPCADCARAIIQAGITAVVTGSLSTRDERWRASLELAGLMLDEAQVARQVDPRLNVTRAIGGGA